MVAVNLRAGFELGRGAGRHMVGAGLRGRILFVTSLHAETPRNLPHYSAAKAGLTMTMKELARALGPQGSRMRTFRLSRSKVATTGRSHQRSKDPTFSNYNTFFGAD